MRPDTLLLELTNPELQAALVAAEWDVKSAEATYTDLKVRLENQRLDQAAQLATTESSYNQAKLRADRDMTLYKEGLIVELNMKISKAIAEDFLNRSTIDKKRLESSIESIQAQLASQGNQATLYWFPQGGSTTAIVTSNGADAQSFLPHKKNSSSLSAGSFTPSGTFGFKVDGESSDDAQNVQEQSGGGWGHHVRFWPARDRAGNLIPNTYILSMDYQGINYDFNDNTYIITNIKPA